MSSKSPLLSRMAWCMKLSELIKTMPPETPDALTLSQFLVDVIVAEQQHISQESLATLCGLAALFCRDGTQAVLPKHKRVDAQGRPVYCEAELAQAFGMTPQQARAQMNQAQKEALTEGVSLLMPEQDTTRLQ
jgi:hypothetical protein